jgi:hypothetical protein
MPYHIQAARNAILHTHETEMLILSWKDILQGSPVLEENTGYSLDVF